MKRWQLATLDVLVFMLGMAVIWLLERGTVVGIILYVVWLTMMLVINRQLRRLRQQQLAAMWLLADTLGYGPAELKARMPRYGMQDWQMSRPPRPQFYPGDAVVRRLIRSFSEELAARPARN